MNSPISKGKMINLLCSSKVFSVCSATTLEAVLSCARWRKFRPNQVIFQKADLPDGLYFIYSGFVDILTYSDDGKEILLNIMTANEHFGEISLIDRQERTAEARASTDVEVLFLPISEWKNVYETYNNKDWLVLVSYLCKLLRSTNTYIEDIYFLNLKERVAKQLVKLCDENKISGIQGSSIVVNISQEKLANMLGVTREVINKILATFENNNILLRKRGLIKIHNIAALKHISTRKKHNDYTVSNVA